MGTGEANNSRSSYWGDGIYKSTNGGERWQNMGLRESHHIGRVLIDPQDANVVYVAALGHLYSDNPERGLYKTINGGETWEKVLEIRKEDGKYVGVVDVAMSPDDPNTLIAAAYDKIRKPWTFNEGGEGSGLYKSTDAGRTWKQLTNGLPGGFLGRIGVAYAPGNANVVYANIENVNVDGVSMAERRNQLEVGIPLDSGENVKGVEVYRSDDGGNRWRKVSPDGENIGGSPAYYYQQVRVDPNDENHVYVLGIRIWETKDGGVHWNKPFSFGGDNHALWIDPNDAEHMLLGYDHGMGITYDAGKTWYHPDEIPLAQCYAVDVDMAYPYNVYSGLQDNGSVRGPGTMRHGGNINFEQWERVGGGDGMYNVPDRTNNRYLYNEWQFGNISRLDMHTGVSKKIHHDDTTMRWNWNAPIVVSQHNTDVIYHAGNKVLKSTFRGESWKEISSDLSNNDPVRVAGTGNIQYGTITALEESPLDANELWAGTDDGNVHVTVNGGKDWTKLNGDIPGNPEYWVSRIEASAHHFGTVYISYTGYRRDDFRPFLYKTTDHGKTWQSISGGLPNEPINVIREDHKNPDLLFVGTELGVYASIDGGRHWTEFMSGLPTNAAYDMVIHPRENELVVATHGRGIFIADISPLQGMTPQAMAADPVLFDIQPTVKWATGLRKVSAYTNFNGESRKPGSHIFFYSVNGDKATLKIMQGQNELYKMEIDAEAGLNHVLWPLQKRVKERPQNELQEMAKRFKEQGMSATEITDKTEAAKYVTVPVDEGTYRVVLEITGKTLEKNALVLRDFRH